MATSRHDLAFERPEQTFGYAATQRPELAVAGIVDGLLQLVAELRVELAAVHREIDQLKEAARSGKPDARDGN